MSRWDRVFGRPQVIWDIADSNPLHDPLVELVEHWLWLVPAWVDTLEIKFEHTEAFVAKAHVSYRYRSAVVRFSQAWGVLTLRERELTVVHELVHARQAPVFAVLCVLMDTLIEADSAEDKLLRRQYAEADEAVTTDMAVTLHRLHGMYK